MKNKIAAINNNPEDGFDARTFLYIRTHSSDNGNVPLPSGLPFWISPDINIISNPSDPGVAILGVPNTIEIIVTNASGIQANDAFVDCFIANPTTAFTPLNATFIGQTFVDIPSYQTKNVVFNWIPTMQGHFCLLARVSLIIPSDTYSNSQIFDVVGDRHIAMRNLHIITMVSKKQNFGFTMANPLNEDKEFEFITRVEDANSIEIKNIKSMYKQQIEFSKELKVNTNLYVEINTNQNTNKAKVFGLLEKMSVSKGIDLKIVEKNQGIKIGKGRVQYANIEIDRSNVQNKSEYSLISIIQQEKKSKRVVGGLMLMVNGG